jgi:hypothetical protein
VQRRILTVIAVLVFLGVVIGVARDGWDFLSSTIELPGSMATIWFLFNSILALGAMVAVKRSLLAFADEWTWQEVAFSRGVFMVMLGSVLGYMSRAWDTTGISLGTPLFTLGVLWLISAMVRPPERFEKETGV